MNLLEEEKVRLQEKLDKVMVTGERLLSADGKLIFMHLGFAYVASFSVLQDKELVLELETMRTKYGVCGRERSPSRLDAFVKSLEEERDYYRQEVERYKRVRGAASPNLSPCRSPGRGRSSWSNVRRVRKDSRLIYAGGGGWKRGVDLLQ